MLSKTELKKMNNKNLQVLRDCLITARKPYDIAYYAGRIDSLEHIQDTLEGKYDVRP
jgi:hypothetical protein